MFYTVGKIIILAIYAGTLAGLAGLLSADASGMLLKLTLVMLAIHILEAVFCMRYLRLYRGSLAASILLTLLFGLLHWKPLADEAARTRKQNAGIVS
jgi:hypothetical protein